MKVICAPDKFKGSLTANEAADAMAQGAMQAGDAVTTVLSPLSDGGEGFAEAMIAASLGRSMRSTVLNPLGQRARANWGVLPSKTILGHTTAVLEMASASGLALVPKDQRNPMRTTSHGTGDLIGAAARSECKHLLLGIGGSATNDGGCGAAQAMGALFFDQEDELIEEPITGGMLASIARIDLAPLREQLKGIEITAACDVTNPLTGPRGASFVYGPQKGATPKQVKILDDGLRHLASLVREQLGVDHEQTPGAGAAGGMGFGLLAFFGATLRPGIDLVLDAVRFDERVQGCDLCLTGEGRFDDQSLAGKVCVGVAKAAKKHGVPTIALVGAAEPAIDQAVTQGWFADYVVIGRGVPPQESMTRAGELLRAAAKKVCVERRRRG